MISCQVLLLEPNGRYLGKPLPGNLFLYRELAKAYRVISIFIGGGTPSTLEAEQMESVSPAIKRTFIMDGDVEFTVEAESWNSS
ncbi:MAG: hypothetical protein V8S14_05990 [Lachnospiraceae bacterium]